MTVHSPQDVYVTDTPYQVAVLVPDATALGDESDATYAEQWFSYRPDLSGSGPTLRAQFSPLPGFSISQMRMRFEVFNDNGGTGTEFVISILSVATSDLIATLRRPSAPNAIITVPATNTIYDYADWEFTQVSEDETLEDALATGLLVSTRRNPYVGTSNTPIDEDGGDYGLRVYELSFEVEELPPTTECTDIIRASGGYQGNGFNAPTVVGAVPIGDESDATYLDFAEGSGNSTVGLEIPTETVIAPLYLHLRMRVFADPTFSGTGEVFLNTQANGSSGTEFAGFSDGAVSGFGFNLPAGISSGIVEFSVPLNLIPWSPTTFADVVTALAAGAYLDFNNWSWVTGSTPPTFRLYEAWLEYTYPCGDSVIRQYPRDDDLGWGSGTRFYPPPKANRIIGGIQ